MTWKIRDIGEGSPAYGNNGSMPGRIVFSTFIAIITYLRTFDWVVALP
jgi:hypothetical protein